MKHDEVVKKLKEFCPVYRNFLRKFPHYESWLEEQDFSTPLRKAHYFHLWESDLINQPSKFEDRLRVFRRLIHLRIAYREISGIATLQETSKELSMLADFCLNRLLFFYQKKWQKRLGVPHSETLNTRCHFCILALGKLGGNELNFCSDIDLVYIYEDDGDCIKNGQKTHVSNREFYIKLAQDLTKTLEKQTEYGFLYHTDLRLRPEGSSGPIIRSLNAMENYYASAGQTWERLAYIKCRPVAGDLSLGHELLESLNIFRYPRNAPSSLKAEVSNLKRRIEKEANKHHRLKYNIKTGFGGIREIEYWVQTLQLINAGKNPFLQCNNTLEALEKLKLYQHIDPTQYQEQVEAYYFLRNLENRLQMQEEKQTHSLPQDPEKRRYLAEILFFPDLESFDKRINHIRKQVRTHFESLFSSNQQEDEIEEWTRFFLEKEYSKSIDNRLKKWFRKTSEESKLRLRRLVLGSRHNLLTRELVVLFVELSRKFDRIHPDLADPLQTLERITQYAQYYGVPQHFLKTCSLNPKFFRSLCIIFDRSRFIYKIVCQNPEIFDEIFYVGLRLHKSKKLIYEEIKALPQENDEVFAKHLWLYVRAEQIRIAISEVVAGSDNAITEDKLSKLADVVLNYVLNYVSPSQPLIFIGLGKYGGKETTFGSDLDLIVIGESHYPLSESYPAIRRLNAILGYNPQMGKTYEIDFRLRPYGNDGPLITTIAALKQYHQGKAWTYEKQILLHARPISFMIPKGSRQDALCKEFTDFKNQLLFEQSISQENLRLIMEMRKRMIRESVKTTPPELSFKLGPGGLVEIEHLCQALQWSLGYKYPDIRNANTRMLLYKLKKKGELEVEQAVTLLDNYNFLRKTELLLRRIDNKNITQLPENPSTQNNLAFWLGFKHYEDFLGVFIDKMKITHTLCQSLYQKLRQKITKLNHAL